MRDNPYKDLPPLERRPDGSLYRMDVVHRGNPNPNRLSDLHGVSARGDGSPLSRMSVADQTAPKARHQKRGNPVRISPFLVRAWGLEPQRRKAREPKSRMSTNSIMPACLMNLCLII